MVNATDQDFKVNDDFYLKLQLRTRLCEIIKSESKFITGHLILLVRSILLRACGFCLHRGHPQGYLACLLLKRDLNGARCKPPTPKPTIKFPRKYIYMGLGGLFLAGVGFVLYNNFGGLEGLIPPELVSTKYGPVDCPCHKEGATEAKEHHYIPIDGTLPFFTLEELRKHTTAQSKIWISLDQGVFDITDYIEQHPEDSKILMMAAGGPLDPFLHMYPIYKEPQVLDLLTKHRIGNLTKEDAKNIDPNDPFSHEPKRHPAMKVVMDKPFNAEPPADILAEHYITPNELFFVRNNLPLPPPVDEKIHKVQISGKGLKTLNIPLNDIKTKFKKHVVTSTIHCVGLRRKEMSQHKPTESLQWDQGCIGTANWGGTRLCEFLEAAGFNKENSSVKHVIFEGLDSDSKKRNYCTSIPIERAIDPDCDVLLAYEMNGKPLSRDHGHPLRVIVPGVAGARQVKYLAKITLSEKEPNSQWQQLLNKAFPPGMDASNLDTTSMPAIQETPVTSAITNLMEGDTIKLHGGKMSVKGQKTS
uniref:sulfite oxidase n=1 Tax=Timema tahoe TaxID=61484 RepID=A0A7R9FEA9_9NEOP|nr:unnamed protein product [Timema tahoe]